MSQQETTLPGSMQPISFQPSEASAPPLPPRIFSALQRRCSGSSISPFSAGLGLAQLASDYRRCVELGGNLEHAIEREEGVSFNPRLARVLSILIADGEILDWGVLQRALYGATLLNIDLEVRANTLKEELKDLTGLVASLLDEVLRLDRSDNIEALTLLGVVLLDDIRHLHRAKICEDARASLLKQHQDLSLRIAARTPEWLDCKLKHAVRLQGA